MGEAFDTQKYTWFSQYDHDRAEFEVFGCTGFIILPRQENRTDPMPWVWYAPTFIVHSSTGYYPAECNGWISRRLLDKGIAVCGIDVGESYGNPQGRAVFTEFYKFVVSEFKLSVKMCLWPQSRGGLMLYNWAAEHPELVKCVGGTYTVCDMASYPGLAQACPAYGMTESELQSHLAEHNPIDCLAPLASHNVPIFHIHGDSDSVVPLEANSAELAKRYKAMGGSVEVVVIEGKGHEEVAEFFESQKMVDFFLKYAK